MLEVEETVARLDKRPGFKVVAHCEIGVPLFLVSPLVTLKERSPIGVLEETVLKCVDVGVDAVPSITAFLGIPEDIVRTQIGALLYERVIRGVPGNDEKFGLTAQGLTKLAEMSSTRLYKDDIRLYVDGLTRQLSPIAQSELYGARQLESQGLPAIPPTPRQPPKATDIAISDVNRLFAYYTDRDRSGQQVIKIEGYVKRTQLMYRRAVALAFKSDSGREINIAFAIDGRLSDEHELSFSRSGADQRSIIFKDLFDANKRRVDINVARRHIQEFVPKVLDQSEEVRRALAPGLPTASIERPELVRTLSSYEHAPLLATALDTTTKRLLIVSPWIRRNVVDGEFITKLGKCLERGVEVVIAFGFGKADKNERSEDIEARKELEELTTRFATFKLIRKSNIHAKILLADSRFFVTTSFNWLSFRGDPSLPLREEEGTYVEGDTLVDDYYQKLQGRLLQSSG